MSHFRSQSLRTLSADTTQCSKKGTFYALMSPVTGFPSTSREGSSGCWDEHRPRSQKIQVSVPLGWLQSFQIHKKDVPVQSILMNSGIPYLRTHLLTNICNPQITIHGAFAVLHAHGQSGQQSELPNVCVTSYCWTRRHSAFWFQPSYCEQVSFSWSTYCHISHIFCTFCWWFHFACVMISVFKMAPKYSADLLSSVLVQEGWGIGLKYVLDKLHQAWVVVMLAMSSMFMNPQYILNKVSLTNTHKIRLCIAQLMEILWTYTHRDLTRICLRG